MINTINNVKRPAKQNHYYDAHALLELAPQRWQNFDKPDILVSIFNYLSPPKEFVAMGYCVDVGDAVIAFTYGKVAWMGEFERGRLKNNGDGLASATPRCLLKTTETLNDWWVIVIQPISGHNETGLHEARESRQRISAMLSATMGPNSVHHLASENVYLRTEGKIINQVDFGVVPDYIFDSQNAPEEKLEKFLQLTNIFGSLNSEVRQRAELALHWFERAHRSSGVDQLINYWVALEALCFTGDSDIKSINISLGDIYNLPYREANRVFGIGKILSLRSNILHGRDRYYPSPKISMYLRAIFVDLFNHKVGLPFEGRARKALNSKSFDEAGLINKQ